MWYSKSSKELTYGVRLLLDKKEIKTAYSCIRTFIQLTTNLLAVWSENYFRYIPIPRLISLSLSQNWNELPKSQKSRTVRNTLRRSGKMHLRNTAQGRVWLVYGRAKTGMNFQKVKKVILWEILQSRVICLSSSQNWGELSKKSEKSDCDQYCRVRVISLLWSQN